MKRYFPATRFFRIAFAALLSALALLSGCAVGDNSDQPNVLGQIEDRQRLYVGPSGDDGNAGTSPSSPLKTVAEAAQRLNGMGGTIEMGAGQYGSQLVSGVRGTSRRPIIIRSSDQRAVLTNDNYNQGAALTIKGSNHVVVEGLIAKSSLWGMRVEGSTDIALIKNTVTDIGQEAIHVGTSSFVDIVDNEISHTGLRPGSNASGTPYANFGEGIYIGCSCAGDTTHDIRISGNEISFTTAEAIDLKPWAYNLLVETNKIHDVSTATSGAVVLGIGVRHYDDPNAVIRNNMIWNVTRTSRWTDGNAISLSAPATVYNNVIWNTQHRGIWVDSNFVNREARNVYIFNNTVMNSGMAGIQVSEGGNDSVTIVEANIGVDLPGNLIADPSWFIDASSHDYRLAPSAPAIDASTGDLVAYDVQGFPRPQGRSTDVGAFEFGSPAPTQALPARPAVPDNAPDPTTPPSEAPGTQSEDPSAGQGVTGTSVPPLERQGVPPQPKAPEVAADSRLEDQSGSLDESSNPVPLGDVAAAPPATSTRLANPSGTTPEEDVIKASGDEAGIRDNDIADPTPERALGTSDSHIDRPDVEASTSDKQEIPSELAYRDVVINPGEQIPGGSRFSSRSLLFAAAALLALGATVGARRKRHQ